MGCGSISRTHVNRLSLLEKGETQIVGLCDVILEKAEGLRVYVNKFRNVAPEPLTPKMVFSNYEEMLKTVQMDAVLVCTPHSLHYNHALKALKKGLHVLVEKPMAVTLKEAEEMKNEADKRRLLLAIGYQKHFQPEYVYVKKKILNGDLGEPHFIIAWLAQNIFAAGRFYLNPELSGGGQIKASGTHLIDIILWVTNTEPKRVKALMDRAGTQVDIYSVMVVELSNGAIASIALSGGTPGLTTAVQEELRIWCENGGAFFLDGKLYLQNAEGDVTRVERGKLPRVSPSPDVNFVRALQGKEECLVPAQCGVNATKLEEMAYKDVGFPLPNKLKTPKGAMLG